MNKKIYNSLFSLTLSFFTITLTSCHVSGNCYKVGYSQQVEGLDFNEKISTGYFIYSYLTQKNSKDYFLYKIDLNGKAEQVVKLGSKAYEPKNFKNKKYTFGFIDNDKLFLNEVINEYTNNSVSKNNYYYLINVNNKEMVYKKEKLKKGDLIFSPDNKNIIIKDYEKSEISIFDIEKGIDYQVDYSSEIVNQENIAVKYEWINSNNILLYIKSNAILKKVIIYEVKNSQITKNKEYKFKSNEPANFEKKGYSYYGLYPISYENDALTYYTTYKYGYKNIYKIDFIKNELSLVQEFAPRKLSKSGLPLEPQDDDKDKINLGAGANLYYIKNGVVKSLLDYREKLPKMFFDDTVICGNFTTEDINNN